MVRWMFGGLCLWLCHVSTSVAQKPNAYVVVIARTKASVVAVGTHSSTASPSFQFRGTGFVVGDGSMVATNAHVLPPPTDVNRPEQLVVAIGKGTDTQIRAATKISVDETHDVALLKIVGSPLAPLRLGEDGKVREGDECLTTGFPLGTVLGLYPVTHRAMIAAIVPISMPLPNSRALDAKVVRRMREEPFPVFQLDATAYPGNSGSPLYNPENGQVVAIINMVFVKGTKEAAITAPSGITYAIPVLHLRKLLQP